MPSGLAPQVDFGALVRAAAVVGVPVSVVAAGLLVWLMVTLRARALSVLRVIGTASAAEFPRGSLIRFEGEYETYVVDRILSGCRLRIRPLAWHDFPRIAAAAAWCWSVHPWESWLVRRARGD